MDEQNQFLLNTTPSCQTSSILLKKKSKTWATIPVLWCFSRWSFYYSWSWAPCRGSSSSSGCRPGRPASTPGESIELADWRIVGKISFKRQISTFSSFTCFLSKSTICWLLPPSKRLSKVAPLMLRQLGKIRREGGTRSTFSENPHPGEDWEGEKDYQSQR